jgi:hypothetical protein
VRPLPGCHISRTLKWFRPGDVVHVNMIGTHIIILNSCEAALSMLDSKGAIYSDRPQPRFACELVGWRRTLVFARSGPVLKQMRNLFAQTLGTRKALARFEGVQEMRAHRLLRHSLDDNNKLGPNLRA